MYRLDDHHDHLATAGMNPFATPEGGASMISDSNTTASGAGSNIASTTGGVLPTALPDSSAVSMTESQPTLSNFPQPPKKSEARGRGPRAVAFTDRRDPSVAEKYTFYREGTPPPTLERIPQPPIVAEQSYDYSYDYVAPPADIPAPTICGLRRRIFWIVLAAIAVILVVAIGVGVGVGVGTSRGSSNDTPEAQSDASSTIGTSTLEPTRTTDAPDPDGTGSRTQSESESTAASTISSNPAVTTLTSCPAANNTIYKVPETDTRFERLCGIDYTGKDSAEDLAHAWTPTMEDCMIFCAGFPGCDACGWGVIKGDPGSYHRCWLKGNLKKSHVARIGWDFAIML